MSVTFNLKGADWAADKQKAASGDEAEYWSKLELNAKKKLWHQLTMVIYQYFETSKIKYQKFFYILFELKNFVYLNIFKKKNN